MKPHERESRGNRVSFFLVECYPTCIICAPTQRKGMSAFDAETPKVPRSERQGFDAHGFTFSPSYDVNTVLLAQNDQKGRDAREVPDYVRRFMINSDTTSVGFDADSPAVRYGAPA